MKCAQSRDKLLKWENLTNRTFTVMKHSTVANEGSSMNYLPSPDIHGKREFRALFRPNLCEYDHLSSIQYKTPFSTTVQSLPTAGQIFDEYFYKYSIPYSILITYGIDLYSLFHIRPICHFHAQVIDIFNLFELIAVATYRFLSWHCRS